MTDHEQDAEERAAAGARAEVDAEIRESDDRPDLNTCCTKCGGIMVTPPRGVTAICDDCATGFQAQMQAVEGDWGSNAQVWPDRESAHEAGSDLYSRWMGCKDFRVIAVDEQPNYPTWKEHVEKKGLPPRRVQL
jgi:hypothetical protein